MSGKRETKLEMFERVYEDQIKNGSWITKDHMTEMGFFPSEFSNGKDIRFVTSKYVIEERRDGNRVVEFRIVEKKNIGRTRSIRSDIRRSLKDRKCPVLNTNSNLEIDHKNGRYNDPRVLNPDTQKVSDFQVISKVVNNIKREVCKKCTETNIKFDAKELGFLVSNLNGVYIHDGSIDGCEGCYYYDIQHFTDSYNAFLTEVPNKNSTFKESEFHKFYNSTLAPGKN